MFAYPISDAVVLFKAEPHETGDTQSHYGSYKEGPKTLTATVQLLNIHAIYRSGKVYRYVNKSQDRNYDTLVCVECQMYWFLRNLA